MDDAKGRAESVRSSIDALSVRYLDRILPPVTISVGVAVFPQSGSTIEAVLKVADNALYVAKENGRNRLEIGRLVESVDLAPMDQPVDESYAKRLANGGALAERRLEQISDFEELAR
jgi:hypothetical protein